MCTHQHIGFFGLTLSRCCTLSIPGRPHYTEVDTVCVRTAYFSVNFNPSQERTVSGGKGQKISSNLPTQQKRPKCLFFPTLLPIGLRVKCAAEIMPLDNGRGRKDMHAVRCSAASSSLVADDDSTQVQQGGGGGSDKTRQGRSGRWHGSNIPLTSSRTYRRTKGTRVILHTKRETTFFPEGTWIRKTSRQR